MNNADSKSCNEEWKFPHVTEELQQHIDREPPPLLHHYTNQHGLLGIISTGEIWATSVFDLNDSLEFVHASKMAVSLITSLIDKESDQLKKRHLGYLRNAAIDAGINICISSWSSRVNDLSQWRAYSRTGTGYSIDLKGTTLKKLAEAQDFILAACIYEPNTQERILLSLINANLNRNIEQEKLLQPKDQFEVEMLEQNGGDFGYCMNRYASLFKHQGFSAEEEWRLISKPLSSSSMHFRAGISTIASHTNFSLRTHDTRQDELKIYLDSVHVGPCPDPKLASRNVRFFLTKYTRHSNHRTKVIESDLPYKTW